jgi:hypothetical protein
MTLCRVICIAAIALPIAGTPAAAQFQSAPMSQAGPSQQPPACLKKFLALRDDAAKKADAIQAAGKSKQKPTPQEACKLFNTFIAAEDKLIKYASDNSVWCGIPDEVVHQMKEAHVKSSAVRTKVCRVAAAGPPRPRGPSLSDALGTNVPTTDNIKTGHGTFDTLIGTPIGNR